MTSLEVFAVFHWLGKAESWILTNSIVQVELCIANHDQQTISVSVDYCDLFAYLCLPQHSQIMGTDYKGSSVETLSAISKSCLYNNLT